MRVLHVAVCVPMDDPGGRSSEPRQLRASRACLNLEDLPQLPLRIARRDNWQPGPSTRQEEFLPRNPAMRRPAAGPRKVAERRRTEDRRSWLTSDVHSAARYILRL